jgi:hypothetical protein
MPPKKQSAAQVEAFDRARSSSPAIVTDFEGALAKCQAELSGATSKIETLAFELSNAQKECTRLLKLHESSKETIYISEISGSCCQTTPTEYISDVAQ